eukprot:1825973-Karenia_brevis.AAC.1
MRGVYCLQEVSGWPDDQEFKLPGWCAIHEASSPSAMLVPMEWSSALVWTGTHCMHTMALLNDI